MQNTNTSTNNQDRKTRPRIWQQNTKTKTHPVELYLRQQASALHRQLTANFEVFDTEYTGLRENLEDPTMTPDIMIASKSGAIPNTTIGNIGLCLEPATASW